MATDAVCVRKVPGMTTAIVSSRFEIGWLERQACFASCNVSSRSRLLQKSTAAARLRTVGAKMTSATAPPATFYLLRRYAVLLYYVVRRTSQLRYLSGKGSTIPARVDGRSR